MEKYQKSKTSSYPQFHAVAMYDVLNHFFTSAVFESAPTDERKAARSLFEKNNKAALGAEKPIDLLDQVFPSVPLIQELEMGKKRYVLRVSKSFLKEVNAFRISEKTDSVIAIHYDRKRAHDAKLKNKQVYPRLRFAKKRGTSLMD